MRDSRTAATAEHAGNHRSVTVSRGAAWAALIAALLGWMFDGAEMGIFSMVGRSAMKDLLAESSGVPANEDLIKLWFNVVMASFLVGAATGGVLFGWLGDRIGRVRAMTLSVLTYAIFTGLCGVASAAWQVGALRFIAALGMGGEWSLGVALVMEVWPSRSRALMAGLIGAAANLGYMLVAVVGRQLVGLLDHVSQGLLAIGLSQELTTNLVRHEGWRLMMLLGTLPAALTFLIRLFVPESERWMHQRDRGATSHWSGVDLLGVVVGALGPAGLIVLWAGNYSLLARIVGSVVAMLLVTVGYAYPVLRYLQRHAASQPRLAAPLPAGCQGRAPSDTATVMRRLLLAAALSGIPLLATWGATQQAPSWAQKLTEGHPEWMAKYDTQFWSAVGAVVGTILAALAGDWLGRRITYLLLCLSSLASLLWLFQGHAAYDRSFLFATFLAGLCTASFYGWLPLYLPELFHTNIRATAQGFAFNFGRILAAIGVLQASNLFADRWQLGDTYYTGGYPIACSAMGLIYVLGMAIIWLAPETRGTDLPE